MNKRSYQELLQLRTFEERYNYLHLHGLVGFPTFGFNRYLNQRFYRSKEWKDLRNRIILRDEGCDLAIFDRPCIEKGIVHHINPITEEDLINGSDSIFDPDNLILCSLQTHNAIHYGTEETCRQDYVDRRPNDTCPWK